MEQEWWLCLLSSVQGCVCPSTLLEAEQERTWLKGFSALTDGLRSSLCLTRAQQGTTSHSVWWGHGQNMFVSNAFNMQSSTLNVFRNCYYWIMSYLDYLSVTKLTGIFWISMWISIITNVSYKHRERECSSPNLICHITATWKTFNDIKWDTNMIVINWFDWKSVEKSKFLDSVDLNISNISSNLY